MNKTVAIAQVAESFPLPEPSAYAPQMITEDAFTADQMCSYAIEVSAPLLGRCQKAEQALRELVSLKGIQEKYARLQPSNPRAHNWSQYISDVNNWPERNDAAWAAARAIVGESLEQ